MPAASEESDWTNLPSVLLDLILTKVIPLHDFLRFAAVCTTWRTAAFDDHNMLQRFETCAKQVPFLVVPKQTKFNKRWTIFKKRPMRSLYTMYGRELPNFRLSLPYNMRCCGSSHGWLAFCTGTYKRKIVLYNPFSRKKINNLPVIDKCHTPYVFPELYIHKVILSANPSVSLDDLYIVAIYGPTCELAVLKYNQKSWRYFYHSGTETYGFGDVIFHKGLLFAAWSSRIQSIDIIRTMNNKDKICPTWRDEVSDEMALTPSSYVTCSLVESSGGDLWMVRRICINDHGRQSYKYTTLRFDVFKVILGGDSGTSSTMGEMVELKSLGGDAVFVGHNHCSSVLASDFPGCQPDSIYFTDHHFPTNQSYESQRSWDVGVYNLKNGNIEMHHQPCSTFKDIPPPIWIAPTPFCIGKSRIKNLVVPKYSIKNLLGQYRN